MFTNQMITGRLMAGLKDKNITREIIESAAIKKTKISRLVLCKVKELIQVKEQSREDVIQLEGKNKVGVHKMTNKVPKTYVKGKRSHHTQGTATVTQGTSADDVAGNHMVTRNNNPLGTRSASNAEAPAT